MKRTVFQKLGDFVLGKGFYIVLFLCVATIGISGYYLVRTVSSTPGEAEPVTGSPTVVLPDSSQNAAPPHTTPSVTTPTTPTVTEPEDSGSQEASLPQTVEEEPAETVQPVEEDPVPAVFTWPVKGEILSGFSLEVLAYDETMGDWRTHSGVDIKANEGDPVKAYTAGMVREIYEDDLMGRVVVLEHDYGLCSYYMNLADNLPDGLEVGKEVQAGDEIGYVGTTAVLECGDGPHLHFELTVNDELIDAYKEIKAVNG